MPRESYAPKGVDTFVFKINKDVEYSLLDCPGNYSVRVATFRGTVITNQQKVKEIQEGGRLKSTLEEAAIKAHKVTMKLRELGHEAYEFHDRHESYVTVGSFDWVGEDRLDGKQEINPQGPRDDQEVQSVKRGKPTGTVCVCSSEEGGWDIARRTADSGPSSETLAGKRLFQTEVVPVVGTVRAKELPG